MADHWAPRPALWPDRGEMGLHEAKAKAGPGLQGSGEAVGVVGTWPAQPGQRRPVLGCPGQSSVTQKVLEGGQPLASCWWLQEEPCVVRRPPGERQQPGTQSSQPSRAGPAPPPPPGLDPQRSGPFKIQKSICLIHALSTDCVPTVCCAEDVMVNKTWAQT